MPSSCGRRHGLGPPLAVEGDGEPVRLVAHPLEQVEALAGARQDDRVVLPGHPDLLEPLGQADQRHVLDAELVEHRLGRVDLRQAAVDDDEVGRVGELARPAGDLGSIGPWTGGPSSSSRSGPCSISAECSRSSR